MALKTKDGIDLLELSLVLNWERQTGLHMRFAAGTSGVVMAIHHVDELIGELIKQRDAMEKLNKETNNAHRS